MKEMLLLRVIKSLIYRIYSFSITWIIVFMLTGNMKSATVMTLIIEIVKTINYLVFEIIWDKYKKIEK